MSFLARSMGAVLLVAALFAVGVLVHEMGHVVALWAFGARLGGLYILGFKLYPRLLWRPLPGYYGYVYYEDTLPMAQQQTLLLCGSLATFAVALIAQVALWITRPCRGRVRLAFLTLCFFWLDILTHTLPTMGIPAYLFFGARTVSQAAEAYLAAVALGVSPVIFQASVVGVSLLLLVLTMIRWYRLAQADRSELVESRNAA